MFKQHLTVLVPELAPLLNRSLNATVLPETLNKIRKRGRKTPLTQDLSYWLMTQFSSAPMEANDLPVASLRRPDNKALCADPCYLHADRDRLLLFTDDLNVTADEAQSLINAIQPLLDDFGGVLLADTPTQWTLELEQLPQLELTAMPTVEAKAVSAFLPAGADRKDWLRLWNEIQMVLFEHPTNQQRQAEGKLPVNSIWLWGSGRLALSAGRWRQTVGNMRLLEQLSAAAGISHFATVASVEQWLQQLPDGHSLYVHSALDIDGDWSTQLATLEADILQPLWQQLKLARLGSFTLVVPQHGSYYLSPWRRWLAR